MPVESWIRPKTIQVTPMMSSSSRQNGDGSFEKQRHKPTIDQAYYLNSTISQCLKGVNVNAPSQRRTKKLHPSFVLKSTTPLRKKVQPCWIRNFHDVTTGIVGRIWWCEFPSLTFWSHHQPIFDVSFKVVRCQSVQIPSHRVNSYCGRIKSNNDRLVCTFRENILSELFLEPPIKFSYEIFRRLFTVCTILKIIFGEKFSKWEF